MELVDRYLLAVKVWLPCNQKNDIIAELSDDLRSQIEEKESQLGRKLADAEVESLLKRFGAPLSVAGRYLPQVSLIGPALFPVYRRVMRALFFYYLLPWLLLWICVAVFFPRYGSTLSGTALTSTLEPWWLACTYSLSICTIVFALIDRSQVRSQVLGRWNPRSLPALRDPNRIPRGSTILELTISIAALALWFEMGVFHRIFHFAGMDLTLSHSWPYFFWALTALSMGSIAIACLNLAHPRWTRFSASLRLGIDCYSWGLVYWLFRAHLLQSLTFGAVSSTQSDTAVTFVNSWMSNASIWIIVVGAIVLAFDVRRILRSARADLPPST